MKEPFHLGKPLADARGSESGRGEVGYFGKDPKLPAPVEKVTIPVGGMTCGACVAHVRKTLLKTPGVSDAAVNLMTREAAVTFDPGAVSS